MNDLDDQIARHAKGYIERLERDLAAAEARIEELTLALREVDRVASMGRTVDVMSIRRVLIIGEADDE